MYITVMRAGQFERAEKELRIAVSEMELNFSSNPLVNAGLYVMIAETLEAQGKFRPAYDSYARACTPCVSWLCCGCCVKKRMNNSVL